jgi:cell division protein FtsL
MRLLNLIVAATLVLAAGYVYKIKVAATVEAERLAKLRMQIVRERDAIAALRAESATLESPLRIQRLADRHLPLKLLDPAQIDTIEAIPFRTAGDVEPETVTAAPAAPKTASGDIATGSVRPPAHASER